MGSNLPLRPAAGLLSRAALRHNLKTIRTCIKERTQLHRSDTQIMALVKADAYGHDLKQFVPELERNGVNYFAVASVEEAVEARRVSPKSRILVLGGTFEWTRKSIDVIEKNRFEVALNDLEALDIFLPRKKIPLHLKLDTGMNRLGLKSSDWGEAIKRIQKSGVHLQGLFTHYATFSDAAFNRQVMLFNEALRWFWSEGIRPVEVHSENTAALFAPNSARKGMLADVANVVRPGLALYGYLSSRSAYQLKPVMELVSEIGLIKDVKKAEGISYGHLYRAPSSHKYGVVPVGYADGLSKQYTQYLKPQWRDSAGKVKGLLSICGAICMDMVMVKAMRGALNTHDRVVFWGRFPNPLLQKGVVEAYELNLRIAKRIPRMWVE
jgi:alanine racemase